ETVTTNSVRSASAVEVATVIALVPSASTFATGFNSPTGLAFDRAGNLYVANEGNGTVSQVTPAGAVSTFASGFNTPYGLAFDAAGSLYVADLNANTVSRVTRTGEATTFASGFNLPFALAVDAA